MYSEIEISRRLCAMQFIGNVYSCWLWQIAVALSACFSICLLVSVCQCVYLSFCGCLYICLSACMFICLSVGMSTYLLALHIYTGGYMYSLFRAI